MINQFGAPHYDKKSATLNLRKASESPHSVDNLIVYRYQWLTGFFFYVFKIFNFFPKLIIHIGNITQTCNLKLQQ